MMGVYLFCVSAGLSKLFCLFNSSIRAVVALVSVGVATLSDKGSVTPLYCLDPDIMNEKAEYEA